MSNSVKTPEEIIKEQNNQYTIEDATKVANGGTVETQPVSSIYDKYLQEAEKLYSQGVANAENTYQTQMQQNNQNAVNQAAMAGAQYREINRNVNELNKLNGRLNTGYAEDTPISAYNAYRNSVNEAYANASQNNNTLYQYYMEQMNNLQKQKTDYALNVEQLKLSDRQVTLSEKEAGYNIEQEVLALIENDLLDPNTGMVKSEYLDEYGKVKPEYFEKYYEYAKGKLGDNIGLILPDLYLIDGFKDWVEQNNSPTVLPERKQKLTDRIQKLSQAENVYTEYKSILSEIESLKDKYTPEEYQAMLDMLYEYEPTGADADWHLINMGTGKEGDDMKIEIAGNKYVVEVGQGVEDAKLIKNLNKLATGDENTTPSTKGESWLGAWGSNTSDKKEGKLVVYQGKMYVYTKKQGWAEVRNREDGSTQTQEAISAYLESSKGYKSRYATNASGVEKAINALNTSRDYVEDYNEVVEKLNSLKGTISEEEYSKLEKMLEGFELSANNANWEITLLEAGGKADTFELEINGEKYKLKAGGTVEDNDLFYTLNELATGDKNKTPSTSGESWIGGAGAFNEENATNSEKKAGKVVVHNGKMYLYTKRRQWVEVADNVAFGDNLQNAINAYLQSARGVSASQEKLSSAEIKSRIEGLNASESMASDFKSVVDAFERNKKDYTEEEINEISKLLDEYNIYANNADWRATGMGTGRENDQFKFHIGDEKYDLKVGKGVTDEQLKLTLNELATGDKNTTPSTKNESFLGAWGTNTSDKKFGKFVVYNENLYVYTDKQGWAVVNSDGDNVNKAIDAYINSANSKKVSSADAQSKINSLDSSDTVLSDYLEIADQIEKNKYSYTDEEYNALKQMLDDYEITAGNADWSLQGLGTGRKNDDVDIKINGNTYDLLCGDKADSSIVGALNKLATGDENTTPSIEGESMFGTGFNQDNKVNSTNKAGKLVVYDGNMYLFTKKRGWVQVVDDNKEGLINDAIDAYMNSAKAQPTSQNASQGTDLNNVGVKTADAFISNGNNVKTAKTANALVSFDADGNMVKSATAFNATQTTPTKESSKAELVERKRIEADKQRNISNIETAINGLTDSKDFITDYRKAQELLESKKGSIGEEEYTRLKSELDKNVISDDDAQWEIKGLGTGRYADDIDVIINGKNYDLRCGRSASDDIIGDLNKLATGSANKTPSTSGESMFGAGIIDSDNKVNSTNKKGKLVVYKGDMYLYTKARGWVQVVNDRGSSKDAVNAFLQSSKGYTDKDYDTLKAEINKYNDGSGTLEDFQTTWESLKQEKNSLSDEQYKELEENFLNKASFKSVGDFELYLSPLGNKIGDILFTTDNNSKYLIGDAVYVDKKDKDLIGELNDTATGERSTYPDASKTSIVVYNGGIYAYSERGWVKYNKVAKNVDKYGIFSKDVSFEDAIKGLLDGGNFSASRNTEVTAGTIGKLIDGLYDSKNYISDYLKAAKDLESEQAEMSDEEYNRLSEMLNEYEATTNNADWKIIGMGTGRAGDDMKIKIGDTKYKVQVGEGVTDEELKLTLNELATGDKNKAPSVEGESFLGAWGSNTDEEKFGKLLVHNGKMYVYTKKQGWAEVDSRKDDVEDVINAYLKNSRENKVSYEDLQSRTKSLEDSDTIFSDYLKIAEDLERNRYAYSKEEYNALQEMLDDYVTASNADWSYSGLSNGGKGDDFTINFGNGKEYVLNPVKAVSNSNLSKTLNKLATGDENKTPSIDGEYLLSQDSSDSGTKPGKVVVYDGKMYIFVKKGKGTWMEVGNGSGSKAIVSSKYDKSVENAINDYLKSAKGK